MLPSSRRTRLLALALVALFIVGFALHLRQRSLGSVQEALAQSGSAHPARRESIAVVAAPPAAIAAPSATVRPAPAPALFHYVEPANAAELDAALRAPTQRIHYVQLDEALIDSKQSPFWQNPDQGRLALPLPNGQTLTVAIHASEMLGAQRFTSTGSIEGHPGSQAIFAYNEGFLHATLEDPVTGTTYELRAATDGTLEQFYQVDPAQVGSCGGVLRPTIDSDALAELARRTGRVAASRAEADSSAAGNGVVDAPPTAAYSAGTNVVVHLMMLYTQGVRATQSEPQRTAAIQSDFDAGVTQVNQDFANSLISARVKLVKIAPVTYPNDELATSAANWQSTMLDAVRKTTDGSMDEIHAIRDQVGADLVCLVQHRFDTTSAGIGYLLDTPGDNFNPLFGFSVVEDTTVSLHVLSHELGHNFGCAHNRENSDSPGAYSYSYGYRFTTTSGGRYRDIMSYDVDNPTLATTYTRLPYFSNPDVIPNNLSGVSVGVPIGVAPGAAGEADNALTIDEGAFEVANFRLQTQTVTNAGTLVNVSTRAFVGTGEQQMIGGFIISGTTPKKMLIRAAGPALVPFGVTGVLPDPKITLNRIDVSTGNPVAVNATGWETQTGGSSSVTANDIINAVPGAFAFARGSKDAALLVSLPPGAYTANIESVSNTTGAALIEAYEVDHSSSNKLFNLSTRAYATKASPIFGGFVVQGDPGTTKRILIRAQGPSLAKFGITTPLNDPIMELYNANSTLIMKNDDWTVNVGSTGGAPDDSKPVVTYYSEQQIAATGLAPSNRREPCLLVDLAPGLYSAVIRPFESLPSQPASPGVAIIEVFEVNP